MNNSVNFETDVYIGDKYKLVSPNLMTHKIFGDQVIEIGDCYINSLQIDEIKSENGTIRIADNIEMNNANIDVLKTDYIYSTDSEKSIYLNNISTSDIKIGSVLEIGSVANIIVDPEVELTYNKERIATRPDIKKSIDELDKKFKPFIFYKENFVNPKDTLEFKLSSIDISSYVNITVNLLSNDDSYSGFLTLSKSTGNIYILNEFDYGKFSYSVNFNEKGNLIFNLTNNPNNFESKVKNYKFKDDVDAKADRILTVILS